MKKSFLLIALLLSSIKAEATTYYTAQAGGNDGRTCAQAQVLATPMLTIAKGLTCLTGGGDTLLVRTGNYNEPITNLPSGTNWSNKVRVAAYPGSAPFEVVALAPADDAHSSPGGVIWLDGNYQYIEFDGIGINTTAYFPSAFCAVNISTNNGNNPHHIRYQNATVVIGTMGGSAAICAGGHTTIGATGTNEFINLTIHGGGVSGLCGFMCAS